MLAGVTLAQEFLYIVPSLVKANDLCSCLQHHSIIFEIDWLNTGVHVYVCIAGVCDLDCGPHGRCEGGACLCLAGWTGERCGLMTCDPR